jgi:hypothetical protein
MASMRAVRDDGLLELSTRRTGLRTRATVLRDGVPVAGRTGFVRVLVPLPVAAAEGDEGDEGIRRQSSCSPPLLGSSAGPCCSPRAPTRRRTIASRPSTRSHARRRSSYLALAQLATLARAERIPFEPAPGMLAARLQRFQRPSKESHRCSAAECQTHR